MCLSCVCSSAHVRFLFVSLCAQALLWDSWGSAVWMIILNGLTWTALSWWESSAAVVLGLSQAYSSCTSTSVLWLELLSANPQNILISTSIPLQSIELQTASLVSSGLQKPRFHGRNLESKAVTQAVESKGSTTNV